MIFGMCAEAPWLLFLPRWLYYLGSGRERMRPQGSPFIRMHVFVENVRHW